MPTHLAKQETHFGSHHVLVGSPPQINKRQGDLKAAAELVLSNRIHRQSPAKPVRAAIGEPRAEEICEISLGGNSVPRVRNRAIAYPRVLQAKEVPLLFWGVDAKGNPCHKGKSVPQLFSIPFPKHMPEEVVGIRTGKGWGPIPNNQTLTTRAPSISALNITPPKGNSL